MALPPVGGKNIDQLVNPGANFRGDRIGALRATEALLKNSRRDRAVVLGAVSTVGSCLVESRCFKNVHSVFDASHHNSTALFTQRVREIITKVSS